MMFGSFGLGGLMMLFVIGIPILLILGVVAIGAYLLNRNSSTSGQSQASRAVTSSNPAAPKAERYCSHCGAGLQAEWTHCPQCGAPVS